jgi:hypothetical protein
MEWEWDVEAERWWHGPVPRLHGKIWHKGRMVGTPLDVSGDSQTGKTCLKKDLPRRSSTCRRRLETMRNFLNDVLDIALSKESAGLILP